MSLSVQKDVVHIPVEGGLIPTLPPLTAGAVFIGSLSELVHDVSGKVFRLGVKTIVLKEFYFDGNAPGTAPPAIGCWLVTV